MKVLQLIIEKTEINDLYLVNFKMNLDDRGLLFEWFSDRAFDFNGMKFNIAQINITQSHYGVVRGIHYRHGRIPQRKFVTCLSGEVRDVVIDLRENSATFGKHLAFQLNALRNIGLLIGTGLGHGFSSQQEGSIVGYLMDSTYDPESESGIHPLDPSLGIDWGLHGGAVLSVKDATALTLEQVKEQDLLPKVSPYMK